MREGMIKVLQIIGNMDIGGMESMLMNYYRNMDRDKIQFDFLIFNKNKCVYEDEIERLGGRIYRITPLRKSIIKNRSEMKRFFKNHHYETIETHQGVACLFTLRLAKKYHTKNIIVHNHGIHKKYKSGIFNLFRKWYILPYIERNATAFFACSKSVLSDLFSRNIIRQKRYHIINNAVDVERFAFDNKERNIQRKRMKVDKKFVIGHVGNFTYPKNQIFIVEIARQMPELLFVLVGSGEYYDSCKKDAPENVLFYGQSEEVDSLMQMFDLFVLPSLWEGLPLVAIEAQVAGLPVLLSGVVSREAVISKEVEYLPLDIKSWVKGIERYANNAGDRVRQSCAGEAKKKGFDCKTEAKRLGKLYLSL